MRTGLIREQYRHLRLGLFDLLPDLDPTRAAAVDSDVGPLWVHTDDTIIPRRLRRFGTWEPAEGALLQSLLGPGMTVVDIGANIGYFSLLCARAVGPTGRVLAVEPEPRNYALLCANLWHAGALNVEPIRAAAHRVAGPVPLSLSETNFGDHRTFVRSGAARVIEVSGVRLDDVLRPDAAVDVVKVDAQGLDHVTIQGFEQTIRRTRPVLVVEFDPAGIEEFGERPLDVLAYYRSLELAVSLLERPGVDPGHTADAELIATVAAGKPAHTSVVLTPIERAGPSQNRPQQQNERR